MPITLNHSNIGVQYSTGSNYIIETVKSDLYRRNENYDNIVRDNLQTAPVIPTTYVDSSGNVYAVESYTYSGSANTADYTRVFPKNTTGDILVIGGGGGGGKRHGGGGGAGTLMYHKNIILNGTYNIKVGKGGAGHSSTITTTTSTALDGNFSQFVKSDGTQNYYAVGGGRGTGSLGPPNPAPHVYARTNGGQGYLYDSNLTLSPDNIFNGVPIVVSNKQYVNTLPLPEGCRGNIGGIQINDAKGGGGGGAGGAGMNHGEESTLDDGYGGLGLAIDITGKSVVYAGGGNGTAWQSTLSQVFNPLYPTIESRGGGGFGSETGIPQNGLDGTGGGGGAQGNDTEGNPSGAGGSGIVIIRYLLGTIPANNLLTTAPTITTPVTFTETIRIFTHSGGAETQTTHSITIQQNTICDILIVGGGGAGGMQIGAGGGGGAVLYATNVEILAGTYTVKVGKGAIPGELSGSSTEAFGAILLGGGSAVNATWPTNNAAGGYSGGSGGGGRGVQYPGFTGGLGGTVGTSTKGTILNSATLYNGNVGGNGQPQINGVSCGGGGGAGGVGGFGWDGKSGGNGGIGVAINITGTEYYWGAGGGGGSHEGSPSNGGKGGGGAGSSRISSNNTWPVGIAGDSGYGVASGKHAGNGTGSGGGGVNINDNVGGNGGSGIVIIKFKSPTGPIPEGITHKRLNFYYSPNYPFIQADNTNLKAWYKFDGNYMDSSPSGFNLTNSGATIVDGLIVQSVSADASDFLETSGINLNGKTYSISFWAKFNTIPVSDVFFWTQSSANAAGSTVVLQYQQGNNVLRFSHYGSGNDMDTTGYNISSMVGTSWHHYVVTYNSTNRGAEIWLDRVKLNTNISTLTNAFTGGGNFTIGKWVTNPNIFNGLMEDFRYYDKILTSTEISQLYSIPTTNTYTVNFPVPTIADINNNSNIVLRGAYDIALSTSNYVIIPKTGQYIPNPTTFTNYSIERIYPPIRNFTAATTTVSGQSYGNGTYVVSYSSSQYAGLEPWTCFNTSKIDGGHWGENRYTSGVFNNTSFIVQGYLGDWIKIQLPVAIKLTKFGFLMRYIIAGAPKDFKIYGSNDNITWVELVNKTDTVYNASNMYEQTTPEITNTYIYYGLVVNKLFSTSGVTLYFDEWYIYGQELFPSPLSIRYNILNPILDPAGAQWTYNTSNTNVYHMGRVGIGTTSPEYQLDVSGTLNAKAYYFNGVQIGRLSEGMVANVQHLTYTHMEVKNNTGWDAINDDLTTGFVISITPKSNLSKILVNLIAHIGLTTTNDARWWGIKLYRKIGTAAWAEVTGSNGTETGSAATTAGTPVWISHNMGTTTAWYAYQIINLTGTYLDSPNTTSTVYYTAYWNQRMGDNPSRTGELWLNRAANQDDPYRPAPSSSWTVKEIW